MKNVADQWYLANYLHKLDNFTSCEVGWTFLFCSCIVGESEALSGAREDIPATLAVTPGIRHLIRGAALCHSVPGRPQPSRQTSVTGSQSATTRTALT